MYFQTIYVYYDYCFLILLKYEIGLNLISVGNYKRVI